MAGTLAQEGIYQLDSTGLATDSSISLPYYATESEVHLLTSPLAGMEFQLISMPMSRREWFNFFKKGTLSRTEILAEQYVQVSWGKTPTEN